MDKVLIVPSVTPCFTLCCGPNVKATGDGRGAYFIWRSASPREPLLDVVSTVCINIRTEGLTLLLFEYTHLDYVQGL